MGDLGDLLRRSVKHAGLCHLGNLAAQIYEETKDPAERARLLNLCEAAMSTAPDHDKWFVIWWLYVRVQQGCPIFLGDPEGRRWLAEVQGRPLEDAAPGEAGATESDDRESPPGTPADRPSEAHAATCEPSHDAADDEISAEHIAEIQEWLFRP